MPTSDPGLDAYLDEVRSSPGPSARELGARGLREASAERARTRPPGPALADVTDVVVPGQVPVGARLYRHAEEPGPVLVYFHGGGWTLGDLDSHDRLCRRLVVAAQVAVLAVDYRRAPEHVWPAAVDDAVAVVGWVRGAGRALTGATSVGVAGDSAGGNIAALCCLRLRDAGEPQPALQALVYPNTDLTFSQPSVRSNAKGWGLDADDALWFAEQWVPDWARRSDPRVSPLLEPDLSGLAPALVVTAEHDPLRDEGDAYADRLGSAGVRIVHRSEPGLVHGFLGLDLVSTTAAQAGDRCFADIGRLLRAPLSGR